MVFSNVVMYFIILASAATLFQRGHREIQSAREAAEALRPLAGEGASLLFALGLVGAGILAVPVLTGSAAYALGGGFPLEGRIRKAGQSGEGVLRSPPGRSAPGSADEQVHRISVAE
jgi:Mn2+/Fe2+ NRAMP family transporter